MPANLSFNLMPLLCEAAINENTRPGTLMLEYFETSVTIGTNTGDVEVATQLGEVLGVINLGYSSVFAAGDALTNATTDGVITTGAVTVRYNTVSIADGALTVRGFLVGKKSDTVLINDPD